jgi:hypothetical protein
MFCAAVIKLLIYNSKKVTPHLAQLLSFQPSASRLLKNSSAQSYNN